MKTMKRLLALAAVFCAVLYFNAEKTAAISPGIDVLRGETRLVKCCVNGQRVGFAAEELEALVGARPEYITVCSLPSLKDGVLKLAGVDVFKGQVISVSGISLLQFVPSSGFKGSGGFTFKVDSAGWEDEELTCIIRFSETVNFAPVAAAERFETYKNVCITKRLSAYDPDGDPLTYVITRYPSCGTLVIDNGRLCYTPVKGFAGADSFVYYALDGYGNKSAEAEASITVKNSKSGIYFADMREDEAHLSAILAAENDIMTYTLIGDSYYFTPDERVSRIDFAVMLVSAAGITVPDKPYPTDIFTDTQTQSREKRLCLEAAVVNGLIEVSSEAFCPDEAISVADAVAMTERALAAETQGIGSAYFEVSEGCLTKKDAAVMLSALIEDD